MKRHWLCNDVMGFLQCANCERNPELPQNIVASLEVNQQWGKPMANRQGCADQMMTAGVGSAGRTADATR